MSVLLFETAPTPETPKKTLYRSHRMIGWEIARVIPEDGKERSIMQTAPHKQEATFTHLLMPVTEKEAAFHLLGSFIEAVEQARFLGLDETAIRTLWETALTTK